MSHFPSCSSSSQSVKCSAETSSALVMEEVSGSHRFEITRYSQAIKLVGRGNYIESAVFYVGGLAWTIRYQPHNYIYGDRYVGLSVALASDATNIRALYKLELLDQDGDPVSWAPTDPVMFTDRANVMAVPTS
uniref:MATH domain-containing protein n=1 Tax=Ananas comosus var. bracteatus TaxID=296719 RepID=A0A6V7P415_ANACO|nr:unnamed protein product [Ananas comosus var. bracteatus]